METLTCSASYHPRQSCHTLKSYQRSKISWCSILIRSDLIHIRPCGNERNIRFASKSIFSKFLVSKLATRWCIWESWVEFSQLCRISVCLFFSIKIKSNVYPGINPLHLKTFWTFSVYCDEVTVTLLWVLQECFITNLFQWVPLVN